MSESLADLLCKLLPSSAVDCCESCFLLVGCKILPTHIRQSPHTNHKRICKHIHKHNMHAQTQTHTHIACCTSDTLSVLSSSSSLSCRSHLALVSRSSWCRVSSTAISRCAVYYGQAHKPLLAVMQPPSLTHSPNTIITQSKNEGVVKVHGRLAQGHDHCPTQSHGITHSLTLSLTHSTHSLTHALDVTLFLISDIPPWIRSVICLLPNKTKTNKQTRHKHSS